MSTSAHPHPPVLQIQIEAVQGLPAAFEEELAQGRSVEILRGEQVIAQVLPYDTQTPAVTAQTFDWEAQRRGMWGDRVFDVDTTQWIREDRDSRG